MNLQYWLSNPITKSNDMKWGNWVLCLYYLLKLSLKYQKIDLGGLGGKTKFTSC